MAMQAIKKVQNNVLTYGQAIKTGILVAVITGIITAISSYIYCEFINPGYAQYMLAEAQKAMITNGETKQQIEEHSKAIISTYSTPAQVMQSLVGPSVAGTVISLIMGLFIKSKSNSVSV